MRNRAWMKLSLDLLILALPQPNVPGKFGYGWLAIRLLNLLVETNSFRLT